MLTLMFDGQVLGGAEHLQWQRQSAGGGATETWRATLDLHAATPAALEAAVAALRALAGRQADLAATAGGATVRRLEVAECRHGPALEAVHEHDPAPGAAHNRRRVVLAFAATLQDADSAVQLHSRALEVVTEAGAPMRVRATGRGVLRRGEDPAAHEDALLPAIPGGYRRVKTAVTRDTQEPALAYETEDERVFMPLPAGVEDGHYVISESAQADGSLLRTTAGFFVGAGAMAQALALGGGERTLRSNPFTRRVDFEYRELVDSGQGQLALTETLSFTTTRRVIDHPLLAPNTPAWRQQVGTAQTEIVQQGSAVGRGRHVAPPAPRYAADLLERHVNYSVPHPGLPDDKRWITAWRYVSRTRGPALHRPPEAP